MPTDGRILVVEDDPSTADFIIEVLQEEGYRVLLAYDHPSMLTMFNTLKPDLMLYNIDYAGGRAQAWLEAARALVRLPFPIVIMTTAAAGIDLPSIEACLVKPFTLDELLDCVARHIHPHTSR